MKNLTPELIEKAKAAKSAEELLALAKENNLEITAEEAKIYFEQLNANGEVSDDALDAVAGGGIFGCSDDEEDKEEGTLNDMSCRCPRCKQSIRVGVGSSTIRCFNCGYSFLAGGINNNL